ncbi:MAG: WD40 repeat domain-containing protein [Planctomycetota bacterium]
MLALLVLCAAFAPPQTSHSTPRTSVPRPPALLPRDVDVLPDGSLLVLTAEAGAVRLDANTGARVAPFAPTLEGAVRAELDPLRSAVAIGRLDGTVTIWPLSSADGAALLDGTDPDVRARRARAAVTLGTADSEGRSYPNLTWTHDGEHLVTWQRSFFHGAVTSPVQVWTRTGDLLWQGPPATDVAVHPLENELALTVGGSKELRFGWPDGRGGGVERFELPGPCTTVSFHPDGSRLAVGGSATDASEQRKPWVWIVDPHTRSTLQRFLVRGVDPMEIKQRTDCVRWSSDGRWLGVTLGKGNAVGILHASSGIARWSGNYRGGRMQEVFDATWLPGLRLLSNWPTGLIGDPDSQQSVALPWMTYSLAAGIPGTDHAVLIALPMDDAPFLARVSTRTGEIVWRSFDR